LISLDLEINTTSAYPLETRAMSIKIRNCFVFSDVMSILASEVTC